MEIYSGDPNAGGSLLASNSDPFETSHVYTAADAGLSILDQLPEGQIFVRAFDQAGNESALFRFPIGEPYFLVGAQLRAVWQDRPFSARKLGEERLPYRRASPSLNRTS